MQCPVCKSYEVQSIQYSVHIPGGTPPSRHTCQKCGWTQEVPATYPPK